MKKQQERDFLADPNYQGSRQPLVHSRTHLIQFYNKHKKNKQDLNNNKKIGLFIIAYFSLFIIEQTQNKLPIKNN